MYKFSWFKVFPAFKLWKFGQHSVLESKFRFYFKTWHLGCVNNYMIMCSGNEGMLEVNEGFGVEAWRKLISNPVIKLSDFVDADESGSNDLWGRWRNPNMYIWWGSC